MSHPDLESRQSWFGKRMNLGLSHMAQSSISASLKPSVVTGQQPSQDSATNVLTSTTSPVDGGNAVPFNQLKFTLKPTDHNMRYACPECQKEFYNKTDFKRHYMVHSGEFPYICPYCSFKARQKGSLSTHLYMKHRT